MAKKNENTAVTTVTNETMFHHFALLLKLHLLILTIIFIRYINDNFFIIIKAKIGKPAPLQTSMTI